MMFSGLPAPLPGQLTIYLFGSGVGESTLVALPDERWLLIDSCVHDGVCLPLQALKTLAVRKVDLFVLTHEDVDHVAGLAELAREIPIGHAWKYPGPSTRSLLAEWCRRLPDNSRLRALSEALEVLDRLQRDNRCDEVLLSGSRPLSWGTEHYQLTPIAPCSADVSQVRARLSELIDLTHKGAPRVADKVVRFLDGRSRRADDHGNTLSLALSLNWQGTRVLFAGDVENGKSDRSGWKGIYEVLGKSDRLGEIRDLSVVGVAHHGSKGAFLHKLWRQHARTRPVSACLVTPFRGGSNNPPRMVTLRSLGRYAKCVALTASPERGGWARVENAGWHTSGSPSGVGHWLMTCIAPDGGVTVARGDQAGVFDKVCSPRPSLS